MNPVASEADLAGAAFVAVPLAIATGTHRALQADAVPTGLTLQRKGTSARFSGRDDCGAPVAPTVA